MQQVERPSIDSLEKIRRKEFDPTLSLRAQAIRPSRLLAISLLLPLIIATQLLFVPFLGVVLSLISVFIWLRLFFALPNTVQKLALGVGVIGVLLILPLGRSAFPSVSYSDIHLPFIYYMLMAFCMSSSLTCIIYMTHLLTQCRAHSALH
jgi:pilus assembly protein TadC